MVLVMRMNPMDGRLGIERPESPVVMARLVITIFSLMARRRHPVAAVMTVDHRRMVQLWDRFDTDGLEVPIVPVVMVKAIVSRVEVVVMVMMVMAVMMKKTAVVVAVVVAV